MLDRNDIDLQNLDRAALTPELWGLIREQVERRARIERSRMMSETLARLAFWRWKASGRGDATAGRPVFQLRGAR